MTQGQVMLGAATMLQKQHGDQAPGKFAERISELALKGDVPRRSTLQSDQWICLTSRGRASGDS